MAAEDYVQAYRSSPDYDVMTDAWAGVLVGLRIGDEQMIQDAFTLAVQHGPGTPQENAEEFSRHLEESGLVRKS